ncbi:hypothetical protein MMC10_000683 [Thelotrema lepadinum]|nr:hypothetical protein [Thelotrema lepadinum]
MKALTIKETGQSGRAEIVDIPEPTIRPGYIKVKTAAVALNPIDWKYIELLGKPGLLLGADYSGIVEEIGPECQTTLKKGDAVFGCVHGGNMSHKEDGCFSEICLNRDGILAKKPESLSFEEAATFPAAILTSGVSLYQYLGLPIPSSEKPQATASNEKNALTILVYGGSTATGMMAIQLAKLSGYKVLTTSSPHNFPLLTSLGASHCFSYHSPTTVGAEINTHTSNTLTKALDCIGSPTSASICAAALSTSLPPSPPNPNTEAAEGHHYVSLQYAALDLFPRADVKKASLSVYTALGEAFRFLDREVPFVPGDYAFGRKVFALAETLVEQGRLKPLPVEKKGGGFEGVLGGLQEIREGRVSGRKLVAVVGETPGL